jgi:peptide/nickel transport system substrate-binding protein
MERRQRPTARRAGLLGALTVAIAALAAIAAGCGGSTTSQPATVATTAATSTAPGSTVAATSAPATTGTETSASTTPAAKPFDVLNVAFTTDLDSMDPAIGYSLASWDVGWYVYVPLLTYQHAAGPDGTILIPALAASMPEISADGTDYKFTLRPGLKYSDGTSLKASDFAYSIKRLFIMDSPGVGYYTDIVWADQFAKTKKGTIPGIITDDAAGTVEFKLTNPRGDFLNILALQFSVPVPSGTPPEDLEAKKPIPSTGPYSIESYQPNQELVVVRNPSYQAIPGIPSGNPDKMVFAIL